MSNSKSVADALSAPTPHQSTAKSLVGHRVPVDQIGEKRHRNQLEYFIPKSGFGNVFANSSSSTVSIEITPSQIESMEDMCLQMTLRNGDPASASYLPTFYWLDHIEVRVGGQGSVEYWSDDLIRDVFLKSYCNTDEKSRTYSEVMNFDAESFESSSNTYGTGTTNIFNLPLNFICLNNPGIYWPHVKSRCTIRFFFKGVDNIFQSGSAASGSQALEDLKLYCWGKKYHPSVSNSLAQRARTEDHSFRAIYGVRQVSDMGNLTAGNEYQQTLDAIQGDIASLTVMLRDETATLEDLFSFRQLVKIDLRDRSQLPIWSTDVEESIYRRFISPRAEPLSFLSSKQSQILIPFCDDLKDVLNKKMKSGSYEFTQNERLHFFPGTTGQQTLLVLAYRYSSLTQTKDGELYYRTY